MYDLLTPLPRLVNFFVILPRVTVHGYRHFLPHGAFTLSIAAAMKKNPLEYHCKIENIYKNNLSTRLDAIFLN